MEKDNQAKHWLNSDRISRRGVLAGAAIAAAATTGKTFADDKRDDDDEDRHGRGSRFAYVGTYTPNGGGIHLMQVGSNGRLTQLKVFPGTTGPTYGRNPSWLALHPNKKFLYAANEIGDFAGPNTTGAVSAFSVNQQTGDLTFLNTVSSEGSGPAHLSVDPKAQYVFVANYGGGNVAVLPILPDGSLGTATDRQADSGVCGAPCPVGPTKPAKAPPGSFANSGHDRAHAHMIEADPAGKFVICNDLGLDLTIVWTLNRTAGTLTNPQTVPSSPGAGPRHFAFHPNGRWFYSLNETSSTLAFLFYNAATGKLTPVSEVQTLPANFVGTNYTSEVMVSPNGRYIYAANRLHDTIAIFSIDGAGRPEFIGEEWTGGDYPRHFNIDPSGDYMYSCNQRSDAITAFRVDGNGRQLKFLNRYTPVGSPACIIFL